MIAVINRLPVKEGMADQIVERFANGRGFVQEFPGFVSMEVLRSDYIPQPKGPHKVARVALADPPADLLR